MKPLTHFVKFFWCTIQVYSILFLILICFFSRCKWNLSNFSSNIFTLFSVNQIPLIKFKPVYVSVGKGRLPWALSVPVCLCWVCQTARPPVLTLCSFYTHGQLRIQGHHKWLVRLPSFFSSQTHTESRLFTFS